MNVLILGMSEIARRRIIPALQALPAVGSIDVATRRPPGSRDGIRRVYADYAIALEQSDAEIVYVSLVNSLHFEWARFSLLAGRHTVVDKPACLLHAQTAELLELADQRSVGLAEATVFLHHPQFRLLEDVVGEHGPITRVDAAFSFPPFPAENFRNRTEFGGGALADLGPYVAALARYQFNTPPEHCLCRVLTRHPATGAETALAVSLDFGQGRSLLGHFGFDTQYQNRINGYGPHLAFQLNRAFTTPPDMVNELALTIRGQSSTLQADRGDAFGHFLAAVGEATRSRNWRPFSEAMMADSALRARIDRSASSGEAT